MRYHDPQLERDTVGSILSGYAMSDRLHPEHVHDPRHARILHAWQLLPRPVLGRHAVVWRAQNGTLIPATAIPALRPHLDTADYRHATVLASQAPVATTRDVARLRLHAARRRRLDRLEHERDRLLQALR